MKTVDIVTKVIHEGTDCTVKAVWYGDTFQYTSTTIYDEDGTVKDIITVTAKGQIL